MWENTVESDGPQTSIWRMPDAQGYKQTHTHTHKYVILITFPQQQWLQDRASLLPYTHIVRLVGN